MAFSQPFSIYIDREFGELQIYIDYYIEPYIDPETGEYFGETNWNATFTDLDTGQTSGAGEWGHSEYGFARLYFGLGTPFRSSVDFYAYYWFSGDSYASSSQF